MKTIKIKPSHESQGDFVLINEEDFDPSKHVLLDGAAPDAGGEKAMTAAELKEALTAKGIDFKGNASKADLQALLDGAAPDA
ncbi:hypothetical protein J7E49_06835 [Variovorax paradoxus]|nr:hypothetical protein [Variovorax paradoxus]